MEYMKKKLKLEGTQIKLIHKYINPLLNRVQTITHKQTTLSQTHKHNNTIPNLKPNTKREGCLTQITEAMREVES